MIHNPKNAKFWVWWQGGWVKIKLTPGQKVACEHYERTDEGNSFECCEYEHTGESVTIKATAGGSDCDGHVENRYDAECPLSDLAKMTCMDGMNVPDWKDVKESRRDEFAELMNY